MAIAVDDTKCSICGRFDEEGVTHLRDDSINGIDLYLCVFCHEKIMQIINRNKMQIKKTTSRHCKELHDCNVI